MNWPKRLLSRRRRKRRPRGNRRKRTAERRAPSAGQSVIAKIRRPSLKLPVSAHDVHHAMPEREIRVAEAPPSSGAYGFRGGAEPQSARERRGKIFRGPPAAHAIKAESEAACGRGN